MNEVEKTDLSGREALERVPVLAARGLVKRFGEMVALDRIDFSIREGEVVAILGPSGSGKSTLVRCLHQLEAIDGGSMYLDGELLGYEEHQGRIRPRSPHSIDLQRKQMGMVFQQFNLFPHWNVLRNITEASIRVHGVKPAEARARGMELLERVGLAHKADAHPRQLSGGQQQRVAIARAVASKPRVILFDEPTSALDPELVGEVLRVMQDLAQGNTTMVVVTHEMAFARDVADRCVFMADGRIVEEADARTFFEEPSTDRLRHFLSRYADDSRGGERP